MQVCHSRNGILKLLVARREGLNGGVGIRALLTLAPMIVGSTGNIRSPSRSLTIVNEDALVTDRLEGRAGHRECRLNVCGLAGLAEVYPAAVSIDLRRGEIPAARPGPELRHLISGRGCCPSLVRVASQRERGPEAWSTDSRTAESLWDPAATRRGFRWAPASSFSCDVPVAHRRGTLRRARRGRLRIGDTGGAP